MTARADTDNYRALFLKHTPMIDLRAPAEFVRGAFPGSVSLPLMTDDERAQVGICYKTDGQEAAIQLGHQLVAGKTRLERTTAWSEFTEAYPECYLYCWRGGLRSQTVQQWLQEAGIEVPRILGGYKAMRHFLLEELHESITRAEVILVSGKTGTGKTRVVERLARCIDLEGLANHRGSSFGQMPTPQPSQIDFENYLSIQFLRLLDASAQPVFLEDEGRLIGRLALPDELQAKMKAAPMLVVEQTLDERVDVVIEDYIIDLGRRYVLAHGEDGPRLHAEKMLSDLSRIQRRLGGERYQKMQGVMQDAFNEQWRTGDVNSHREWTAFLLAEYYDPMYEYQLDKRGGERLFAGDREAILTKAREITGGAGTS
jgi:tRNA 2-selenouridine synthase